MNLSPQQKTMLKFGVPIVAALGLVAYLRSRSSSSTSSASTGSTAPVPATTSTIDAGQLASFENGVSQQLSDFAAQLASPTGAVPTSPPVTDPTTSSGGGTTTVSPLPTPAPTSPAPVMTAASALGFTNPTTPVAFVGGTLIDTATGRPAYYGKGGQPGSATPGPGLTASWQEPGGQTVYYDPNNYAYSDPTRAPDIPPLRPIGPAVPTNVGVSPAGLS